MTRERELKPEGAGYGGSAYGGPKPEGALEGKYFDPGDYMRGALEMLEHIRAAFGFEIELLHDVHERLEPMEAVRFAKEVEPIKLFFLEDLLPPEQIEWFRNVRQVCTTPLAMGELFVHPNEWVPLVKDRLIDFLRMHISAIGGLTPAKKAAVLSEAFGVRTAWHGPRDVSPFGHTANVHLSIASPNLGVLEFAGFSEVDEEIFDGCCQLKNGFLYPNDRPGWGMAFDEKKAKQYPPAVETIEWTQARRPDGGLGRP